MEVGRRRTRSKWNMKRREEKKKEEETKEEEEEKEEEAVYPHGVTDARP